MTITTRDLGIAIRDFIEGRAIHPLNVENDLVTEGEPVEIEFVDVADPHNPVVFIGDREFRIHIVAR